MRILVIRNDKLGDFMLAYPALALLKESIPDATITVLVPAYTREMAEACPFIDDLLIDPGQAAGWSEQLKLLKRLRSKKFDAAITLFSTSRIGWLLMLAGIAYRLAPATKLAQIFYNHRLTQRRSRSIKPEFEYNRDLVRHFLTQHHIEAAKDHLPPLLCFDDSEIIQIANQFRTEHGIASNHKLIMIHPGSGGSANNLSLQQYADIANKLNAGDYTVIITAGPGEEVIANNLAKLININTVIYTSNQGLRSFAKHIQFVDLFISGSTGPLHIAGALNVPTAAFYPRRRSATPLRWQTLNSEDRRLAFTPAEHAEETDVSSIDIDSAIAQINQHYFPR